MISKNFKKILLISLLIAIPIVAYAGAPDIGQMMQNLKRDLPRLVKFIAAVSYITGFFLIFSGFHELKIYGQMRTMMAMNINITGPIVRVIIGTFMMFLPSLVNLSVYTLWNYGSKSVLLYPSGTKAGWEDVVEGVVALVRVIGYVAFIRGLVLITRATRQGVPPGMMSKAITHIIGGVLAINIVGTIDAIKGTFGWT